MTRPEAIEGGQAGRAAAEGARGVAYLWLLALLAAAVSVAAQGFVFGDRNNVFHAPIVLRLPALAQFRDDAFYKSLKNFISVVYPVLRVVATERNVATVFLGAQIVARTVALFALLRMITLAARTAMFPMIVAAGALALCPLLAGVSPIGEHDLFQNYFTHSELATAVAIAAVLSAARGHHRIGAILGGLAFDCNAFVGVWTAPALAAVVLATVPRSEWRRQATRRIAEMGFLFAVCASPVIWWMFRGGALGRSPGAAVDYRTYLKNYGGSHHFVGGRDPALYLLTLQIVTLGSVSLLAIRRLRPVAAAYAVFASIFAIGVVLPKIAGQALLLNLMPMRADGVLILLGVGALLAAAFSLAADERDDAAKHPLAMVLAVAVAAGYVAVATAALATLLIRNGNRRLAYASCIAVFVPALLLPLPFTAPASAIRIAFIVAIAAGAWGYGRVVGSRDVRVLSGMMLAAAIGGRAGWLVSALLLPLLVRTADAAATPIPAARAADGMGSRARQGGLLLAGLLLIVLVRTALDRVSSPPASEPQLAVAAWARAQTKPEALFLVPLPWGEFQWRSQRRVWVTWSQGAAVKWDPPIYWLWYPRWRDVERLKFGADGVRYACTHAIDFVLVHDTTSLSPAVRFSSGEWSVVDAARACPALVSGVAPDSNPGRPAPPARRD